MDFFETLGYAQLNKGCPFLRNHLERQTPFSTCASIMQKVLILWAWIDILETVLSSILANAGLG